MSIASVIGSISIPVGMPGSFFIDPNAAGLAASNELQGCMATLFAGVPSVGDMTESFSAVVTSTTAYTTDKLSKMPTELPMMQSVTASVAALKQRSAQSEVILEPSDQTSQDAIDSAFPPGSEAFATGCPNISDAFKALTEGVQAAFDGIQDGIASMFEGLTGPIKDALEAVLGPLADGQQAIKNLLALPQAALQALSATVTSMVQTIAEVAAEMAQAVTDMVGSATAALNEFASSVLEEAKALRDAAAALINVNFLSMFGSLNDCVQQMMGKVSNPAVATNDVKNVVTVSPAQVNQPTTNAIAQASTGADLEQRPIVPDTSIPPPTGIPNPYCEDELEAIKSNMLPYFDDLQTQRKNAASWLKTNVEEWKESVQWQQKQVAAGATTANPDGTTTDPVAKAAWDQVYQQYIPKRDQYNNVIATPLRVSQFVYTQVAAEYTARKQFGKTPYTNMASRGIVVPETKQTTFLDTGK